MLEKAVDLAPGAGHHRVSSRPSPPTPHYLDAYVEVGGVRLHYVDYGGEGEVVLGLPGLVQTARVFDTVAPILVPRVRLLALDLRGRGGSGWSPLTRYKMSQYLADLQGFLAALGLARVALIGTSLGGGLALMQALLQPRRVTRLVLNDSTPDPDPVGLLHAAERTASAPSEFAGLDEAMAWFLASRDGLHRLDRATLARWVGYYLTPTAEGRLRFNCDPAMMGSMLVRPVPRPTPTLVWEQMKRLTMPVLILRGARSDVLLPETAERLLRLLPEARLVEVPDVGHAPTLFEPEAQAAIGEFFGATMPTVVPAPVGAHPTGPQGAAVGPEL